MKVLLTGANGFVGSHVLDGLRARGIPAVVLLRPASRRQFLEHHQPPVEVRTGSLDDAASLREALREVTHVIHCAGAVKALRPAEFHEVNQLGTRRLVEAIHAGGDRIVRLVHVSSLAAAGPTSPDRPLRESDLPCPISEYGRSKLAAEQEVRERCKVPFVILRPPAVYGPRDGEFLRLFKAVRAHLRPNIGGGRQALSLVFVKDLAEAVLAALTHPAAPGQTFFVASHQTVTVRELVRAVAETMQTWTVPLPLPGALLWPICLWADLVAHCTKRATVLGRQKYPELRAAAWLCDPTKLRQELGFECATDLKAGLAATLAWYRQERWL